MHPYPMDDMLKKLGQDFAAFAGTLRAVERTADGSFIVPVDVMSLLVGHVTELFGTMRRTHTSVRNALERDHISREKAWDVLMDDPSDESTAH